MQKFMFLSADKVPFIYKQCNSLCSSLQRLWHMVATRGKLHICLRKKDYKHFLFIKSHRIQQLQVFWVLTVFVH